MRGESASYGRFLTTAVLIGTFLTLLGGCSSSPKQPTSIPALEPRAEPEMAGSTYRDLADHALHLREAFGSCEADKKAARDALKDKK